MKNFLLAWYGITDLRAALGYEPLGGPVLGALRTGRYTDAIVLAYTDPDKDLAELEARYDAKQPTPSFKDTPERRV